MKEGGTVLCKPRAAAAFRRTDGITPPDGRSVDKALRVVDALQFHEEHGDVCPANWHKGEKALKATQKGVADYLGQHK